jgi:predicted nucleic acid-binding protein
MSSVYIETSIISYLTARVSRDLIVAGHQQMTEEWWSVQRNRFELWASELVVEEASAGDASAAAERLKVLNTIEMLDITEEAGFLATALIERGSLPAKASADALHIAIAAVHNVDYLLTWNCKHIANAEMRPVIESVCRNMGFTPPILCTPEELMGR